MERKFGALRSSSDPSKLGDTVKGGILALSVLIIYGAKYFGFEVTSTEVTDFAIDVGSAVSAIWVAYGLAKKVVIGVYNKFRK